MLYVYRIMQKNTISGTHIRTSAVAEGTTLKHRTKLDCINHWRCGYWLFRRYTSVLSGLEMFHDINLLLLTDWLTVSFSVKERSKAHSGSGCCAARRHSARVTRCVHRCTLQTGQQKSAPPRSLLSTQPVSCSSPGGARGNSSLSPSPISQTNRHY